MAKQKVVADNVVADKKESATAVSGSEASVAEVKPATKSVKIAKLAPKNKSRLPRKQKKAKQKAAGGK